MTTSKIIKVLGASSLIAIAALCSSCASQVDKAKEQPPAEPSSSSVDTLSAPSAGLELKPQSDPEPMREPADRPLRTNDGKVIPVRPSFAGPAGSNYRCYYPDGDFYMTVDKASCDEEMAQFTREKQKKIPESQLQSPQEQQIARNRAERAREQCFSKAIDLRRELVAKGYNADMAQNMALIQLGCK